MLSTTANTGELSTIGILSNSGTVDISKNLVYGFSSVPTANPTYQYGISVTGGTGNLSNNMIRLGFDISGSPQTAVSDIAGIYCSSTSTVSAYHNSIYLGGTGVTAGSSYAFRRNTSSGTYNVRNNIFVNERSNSGGSGKHFAYWVWVAPTTSDYNIYYATGTGGILFSLNGTDQATLQGMKSAMSGQDLSSGVGNPNFVAPTAATPDLHLNSPTPAEGTGIAIGTVTDDFDGDVRASTTPTDIGADAVNATASDIFTPAVTVSAVTNQAVCTGTIDVNITATITDAGSGIATGANEPRLWYRLSAGSGSPTAWAYIAPSSTSGSTYNYVLNLPGVVTAKPINIMWWHRMWRVISDIVTSMLLLRFTPA
ncbi:MAG: hypothetical protein IPP77_01915 [Bacteroidetes bacterium]|nr:hypothetical protein [Bacteroidota bacterium]